MNVRGVTPVGVAQMRIVQVPLVERCLGRVVNGIDNSHNLNYLGKLRGTQFKK
jgi:hypothetical protein